MDKQTYRKILYAVGSLPFWTGKRKLISLLTGDPGSFWDHESPLKPIYLNQSHFGTLSDRSESEVRRAVMNLIRAQYVCHEKISNDKPYTVVKFTDKGVKKFYNLLVLDRGLQQPYWWLHHVSRLESELRSPISTGGELLPYNDSLYITQAPAYRSDSDRMQSDQTLRLDAKSIESSKGHVELKNIHVRTTKSPCLTLTEDSTVETVTSGDLGEKLDHFGTGTSQVSPPNPYVIKGRVSDVGEPDRDGLKRLQLTNSDDQSLTVLVPTSQIPDEIDVEVDKVFLVGPLRETKDEEATDGDSFELKLRNDGEIRPMSH